jgi:predicted RNA-binding Zn-ribbon protein involved in translation (DUF1610 family)
MAMALAASHTTFGDLARDELAIEVTCPRCGHRKTIDGNQPRLRHRRIAGARFRCEKCGSVGLQSIAQQGIDKQGIEEQGIGGERRWPERLAEQARKLR